MAETDGVGGSVSGASPGLPAPLAELVEDFSSVSVRERLTLLLEISRELPDLPPRYADDPSLLEQVHECQSPLFLAADVEPGGGVVHLYFSAPPEAPTTRGFAAILQQGLEGATAQQVLDVPDDFYRGLGLADAVSPLRLRGMAAMLARVKRQVRSRLAAA